jgi:uncharacterized protein (TIGR00251 family)
MLFLDVKVFPNSGKHAIVIDKTGIIRCYVKAAPENGKANRELIKLLADICAVPTKHVSIKRGLTDRKKYLAIDVELTLEQFLERLNSGVQKKLF